MQFIPTWQFILGLIAIGFFVGFGWAIGAWLWGVVVAAFSRKQQ